MSTKAQSTYIRAVRHFAGYLGRSPDTASAEDLRRYILHCVDRGVSPITLNVTITGLRFFFEVTLKRPELMSKMSHIRMARTLPVVLSREEASRLIESASTLKHRTALSVAYGAERHQSNRAGKNAMLAFTGCGVAKRNPSFRFLWHGAVATLPRDL
jgi:integrase/recombinase XerD